MLGEVDRRIFGAGGADVDPFTAVARYRPYVERELARGAPLAAMTHPMIGLFHGWPGARAWRRTLTVEAVRPGADVRVIDRALEAVVEAAGRRERAAVA
jgi:tRNA-dihydrouridine synthase A